MIISLEDIRAINDNATQAAVMMMNNDFVFWLYDTKTNRLEESEQVEELKSFRSSVVVANFYQNSSKIELRIFNGLVLIILNN